MDCTIIIVSNRTDVLEKSMANYAKMCRGYRVIVAHDGVLGDQANMKGIDYYSLPGKSLDERLKFASEMVNTKFVVFCGDDDFINVDALPKLCNHLDNNADCSAVVGRFYTVQNKKTGQIKVTRQKKNYETLSDHLTERLLKLSYHHGSLIYAVMRKELFEECAKISLEQKLVEALIGGAYDLIFPLVMSLNGKIAFLEVPFFFKFASGSVFERENSFVLRLDLMEKVLLSYKRVCEDFSGSCDCELVLRQIRFEYIEYLLRSHCRNEIRATRLFRSTRLLRSFFKGVRKTLDKAQKAAQNNKNKKEFKYPNKKESNIHAKVVQHYKDINLYKLSCKMRD